MALKKNATKTDEKKKRNFASVFTLNESKKGDHIYLKPKFGKFGVKNITIETINGEILELDEDSVLWAKEISGTSKDGNPYSFHDISMSF